MLAELVLFPFYDDSELLGEPYIDPNARRRSGPPISAVWGRHPDRPARLLGFASDLHRASDRKNTCDDPDFGGQADTRK